MPDLFGHLHKMFLFTDASAETRLIFDTRGSQTPFQARFTATSAIFLPVFDTRGGLMLEPHTLLCPIAVGPDKNNFVFQKNHYLCRPILEQIGKL